jgi:hypothetical protein
MPYVEDLARLGFEQDQARLDSMLGQNEMLQHELDIMNQTKDYRIDNARLQNLSNQLGVDAQTIENYILNQTKQDRIDQSAAQLERILLGNENQRTNNMINRETAQAQINRPYIANSGAILANNNQVTQNRILNETADNKITQFNNQAWLSNKERQAREQMINESGLLEGLGLVEPQGTGNEMAIDIKELLPTPEGTPQLALNSADTVVYAQTGRPYVDSDGNSYVAQKDVFGSNRTFAPVNPNNYLSGGSDVSDFRETGNDDEPGNGISLSGIIDKIGGGKNQPQENSNGKYQPRVVIQSLKEQAGVQSDYELNQALRQLSPEKQQQIEQTYGYTIEDLINNMTGGQ